MKISRPRNKYGAVKVKCDGHTFDSKREHARYIDLLRLKAAKEITGLIIHPTWQIIINGIVVCRVMLDFSYITKEMKVIHEDVKGKDNQMSQLKRKMLEAAYGIKVTIIK